MQNCSFSSLPADTVIQCFQDTLKRVKDTPVRDVFSQADPG